MPNWCYNRVSVYSENTKDMDELFDIFNNENPFNALIPSPKWSEPPNEDGEVPVLEEHKDSDGKVLFTTHKFPKSGKTDDRWYDWQIQNWGTKWEPTDLTVEQCDEEVELTFNTAWSPPEEICRAIRNRYPDCSVSWFYDEPGCEIAGYL